MPIVTWGSSCQNESISCLAKTSYFNIFYAVNREFKASRVKMSVSSNLFLNQNYNSS
jgi:hypothetical protein